MTRIVLTYEDYAALPDDGKRDAHRLEGTAYHLDARLDGSTPRALPPFPDLLLDPAAIWP